MLRAMGPACRASRSGLSCANCREPITDEFVIGEPMLVAPGKYDVFFHKNRPECRKASGEKIAYVPLCTNCKTPAYQSFTRETLSALIRSSAVKFHCTQCDNSWPATVEASEIFRDYLKTRQRSPWSESERKGAAGVLPLGGSRDRRCGGIPPGKIGAKVGARKSTLFPNERSEHRKDIYSQRAKRNFDAEPPHAGIRVLDAHSINVRQAFGLNRNSVSNLVFSIKQPPSQCSTTGDLLNDLIERLLR